MLAILFAHAVATAVAPLLVHRWGRMAFYPLALVPLGSLIWVALNWPSPGSAKTANVEWVPELSMNITLRFDALAAIMSVLVLAIGALVLFYCADYFHHHDGHTEKRLPSFAAELVAFSGAMFGLVCSDNMLVLYVFWELTTVLSFLLVGHYAERATSRRAATQALLVTTFGGLAMLVGIVVLGNMSGTYLLSELIAAPPTGIAASVGVVLVLIGALAKSAIVPMHFWLPGAMAAPTPVSAYLHAAAMVKAGVYLVARMSPGFADSPPWRPMVVILGVLTMLLAGWRAVREYDLKLILAFGTVSQLGLITVMVGAGGGDLMLAGLAMLCAHAMFKASLFMVVGVIDHATGTRDIRRLAWLGHGRAAAVPRLRRQGGRLRNRRARTVARRSGALRARRHRARVRVHHHLQPAIPCGSVRPQGITATEQAGRGNTPAACHLPRRACHPGRRGLGVRRVARRPGQRARQLRGHGARR
jgi:multicomponent Na+:H+ antiporter subunit A